MKPLMEGDRMSVQHGLTGPDMAKPPTWLSGLFPSQLLGSTRKTRPAFLNVPDAVNALPTGTHLETSSENSCASA